VSRLGPERSVRLGGVPATRTVMWTQLWIPNPLQLSMGTRVSGLFGPRPRPLTMRVRERGRGPNRKEGWWWTRGGFGRWVGGPEIKSQKRTDRNGGGGACAGGRDVEWRCLPGGRGAQRCLSAAQSDATTPVVRAATALASFVECSAAGSETARAAAASSARKTGAAIVRTWRGAPLSLRIWEGALSLPLPTGCHQAGAAAPGSAARSAGLDENEPRAG
jgi:hypothetical protein